jgi:hypothetical protein
MYGELTPPILHGFAHPQVHVVDRQGQRLPSDDLVHTIMAVEKLPNMVRTKLLKPAADARSFEATPDNTI